MKGKVRSGRTRSWGSVRSRHRQVAAEPQPPQGASAIRPGRDARSLEAVDVRVDDVVAHEERDDPAQREERPERDGGLASRRLADPGDDHDADDDARDERDEDRRRDGAAQVQAQDARELDVPHPHAARVERGGEEEERERGGARDQLLGHEVEVEREPGDERGDRRRQRDRVRDAPRVEVDQRDRHERRDEQQAEDDADRLVLRRGDEREQQARPELDRGVAPGDRRRRRRGSGRAAAASRGPARCRTSGSACRSSGSATAARPATPRAAAGRRRRSGTTRSPGRRGRSGRRREGARALLVVRRSGRKPCRNATRRARGPASRVSGQGSGVVLPGAACLAAAVAGGGAGAGVAARGDAVDRERVTALRRRRHRERRCGRGGHRDLAGAGAVVQARRAERRGGVALGVVLGVREARLDLRDEVTGIGLGRRVLALLLLAEERRESDRGEDADDQDDDQKLDEREALVVALEAA